MDATSTSAGRGGTSDYISCLRCHRVFPNGLLIASTTHQARDAVIPESHPTQPRLPPGFDAHGAPLRRKPLEDARFEL